MNWRAAGDVCVGLGYRDELRDLIWEHAAEIAVLELISEALFDASAAYVSDVLSLEKPIVLHGIHLSPGSQEPPSTDYMSRLRRAIGQTDPLLVSDHISISRFAGMTNIGHLSPIAFNELSLEHVIANLTRFRDVAQRPIAVENIACYYTMPQASMSESRFLSTIVERVGCGLLLDLNNVHVNACNLGVDPMTFFSEIPLDAVVQVHLAGGDYRDGIFVDTHGHAIGDEVWSYFDFICRNAPNLRFAIIERDQNFDQSEVLAELRRARSICDTARPDSAPKREGAAAW